MFFFRIAALAVVSAVLITTIRGKTAPMATLLSLSCICVLFFCVVELLVPILSFAQVLRDMTQIENEYTIILLKTAGIGLLTQIASTVCTDAGEGSVAKVVEFCGSVATVYVSLPLFSVVLPMTTELLGG